MNAKTLKVLWLIGLVAILIAGAVILFAPGGKPTDQVKPAAQRQQYEPKVTKPLAEASANDPLLKKFEGISWGMTKDELTEKFGKGLIPDSSGGMIYRDANSIYGTVTYTLALRDGKLNMILASVSPDDKLEMLRMSLNARYGTAMTANYTYAMLGKMEEDLKSKTLAWQTADTVICMNDSSINYVPASPGPLAPEGSK